MATVNSKELVDEIIAGNGFYEDDPQVVKVVQYTNLVGGTAFGLMWKGDDLGKYAASAYINNPKTIWEAK